MNITRSWIDSVLGVTLLWGATATSLAQADFTRVTNTVLTAEVFSGTGATWVDINGDGLLDLAQAAYDGPNRLFINQGDGSFTRMTNVINLRGPESYGVAWGDFDNDGQPDVFFADGYDSGEPNLLFHNQMTTQTNLMRVTTGPGSLGLRAHSTSCAWADYDRDGFLDLFVSNSGSPSELWHNNGDGTFTRVTKGRIVTNVADSIGATWGDYDNDGWPDLFVANGYGSAGSAPQKNFLYHNNRDGTFTQIMEGDIATDSGYFCGAAWADYDNDGFLDLFVTSNGGPNRLYHNNGDGTFTEIFGDEIVSNDGPLDPNVSGDLFKTYISASWADYDNDGWLDLFVSSRVAPVPNLLFHNNGDGTFTRVTSGPMLEDFAPVGGAVWGDYDNDGFPDLFVSVIAKVDGSLVGGTSYLYHNEGTTNHWLKIRLHPAKSNRSGIGAKVRLTAAIAGQRVTQLREISSGDGLGGGTPEALFGLGDTKTFQKIVVEWPSGTVSTLPNPDPSNIYSSAAKWLDIFEPAAPRLEVLPPTEPPQTGGLKLHISGGDTTSYAFANPTNGLQVFSHVYAIESSTDLVHWSATGATVATLPDGSNTIGLSVPQSSSTTTSAEHWFLRARDMGFTGHSVE